MTDFLRDGSAWLAEQMINNCSSQVVYRQKTTGVEKTLAATVGRSDYESFDSDDMKLTVRITDFLIDSAALGFEPAVGDIITDGGKTFEVLPVSDEKHWRWSDGNLYRIHTKGVGNGVVG